MDASDKLPMIMSRVNSSDSKTQIHGLSKLYVLVKQARDGKTALTDHDFTGVIIPALIKLLDVNAQEDVLRLVAGCIRALCEQQSQLQVTESALVALSTLAPIVVCLEKLEVPSVLHNLLITLQNICCPADGSDTYAMKVVRTGVVKRIIALTAYEDEDVSVEAMELLACLAGMGNDAVKRVISIPAALNAVVRVFNSSHSSQRMLAQATRFIENILCSDDSYVTQLIIDTQIIPNMIACLQRQDFRSLENEVPDNAARGFSNFCVDASPEQIYYLVTQGVIPILGMLLTCHSEDTVIETVDIISLMLESDVALLCSGLISIDEKSIAEQIHDVCEIDEGNLLIHAADRFPSLKPKVEDIMTEYYSCSVSSSTASCDLDMLSAEDKLNRDAALASDEDDDDADDQDAIEDDVEDDAENNNDDDDDVDDVDDADVMEDA